MNISMSIRMSKEDKRKSRILALQVLYAQQISENSIEMLLEHLRSDIDTDGVMDYANRLSHLTIEKQEDLDLFIIENAHNWDFNRISLIDKLVLRLSIAEMIYEESVPPKVSIVEGVEIAKEFGTEKSGGFVNGILDSIYNKLFTDNIEDLASGSD